MRNFAQKRVDELQKSVNEAQSNISILNKKNQSDFILPETQIKRNMIADGFQINDQEVYVALLQSIANIHASWWKPDVKWVFLHAIIYALWKYFWNHFSDSHTERRNVEFYMDHTSMDSDAIHLSELQWQSIAVCAEKASVTHNYLKFLGLDSQLIFSSNCKLWESDTAHAYIIFSTQKGNFIFDPTNSILHHNENEQITSFSPAVYKISQEDFEHFTAKDGTQVAIEHKNQKIENGKYIPFETQVRVYW